MAEDTNYTYGVINGAMPSYGGYDPMAAYYTANLNIGPALQNYATGVGVGYAGQLLGNQLGGEWGNAIGSVAGNLGSNIISAGNISNGLKNFADLDLLGKSNMSTFGTKNFKGFGNMTNLAGSIASGILDRSTEHQRTSGKYGTVASIADMGGGLIGQLGNYGGYSMLGQLGMSAVNKITGGTDGMTVADSLMGSSALAGGLTAINPIAGAAYVALSGINSATGKTTAKNEYNDFMSNENLAHMAGSYGKSTADNQNALLYGNKKYGGFSTLFGSWDKANNKVLAANNRRRTMLDIYDRYDLGRIRGADMYDINSLDWNLDRFGGYNQYGTLVGRKGMKLPDKKDIDRIKNILQHSKIDSFKKGGLMNVIPEGALHARLHHMENGDKITKKGIPVVDKSGEQLAEIERDEIIFSLDVTTKLEALRKDGSDKAAIAAGKLLVDEIFNNTDDRTGLIADVIGKDESKKSVFKQGGIIEIEEPLLESELEIEEPVGIEEVEYYQDGGKYKVPIYINVEEGKYPRTEGDIIYATTPELKYHEYAGHFAPNDKLLLELELYWKDLDDTKLQLFGTDLGFVNKDDINYFFNPNEVLGRVEAARYMLGNDIWKVNPEFFINLKNDENKYGDNMRDLLHMYNPEILTQIFEIARNHQRPIITGLPYSRLEGKELLDSVLMDKKGGILAEMPSLDDVEEYQDGGKTIKHWKKPDNWTDKKIPYDEWVKDINPNFLSENYDLKSAYENYPKEQLEKWKWSTNLENPEIYLNYNENGYYPYHLGSVVELPNGDYKFLKLGRIEENPELIHELWGYKTNENGLANTHNLVYEGNRYWYKKKKI